MKGWLRMLYPHCGQAAEELSAAKQGFVAATERVKRAAVESMIATSPDPDDGRPERVGSMIAEVCLRQRGLRRDP